MKRFIICFAVLLVAASSGVSQWLPRRDWVSHEVKLGKPQKYLQWFYGQRAFGLGYIPKGARLKGIDQQQELRRSLSGKGKQLQALDVIWTEIGPINIEPGNDAHSGRVRAIVTHPTEPSTAYAAAAMGGVWKTTNGGEKWAPLSDDTYSLAFGALAIDPSNPNNLYGGTGEQSQNIDGYYGIGVIKSTDGGATWKPSGLSNVGAFSAMIVHPTNPNRVYASGARSGGGVYVSNDAGSSWQKLSGGLPPADVTDLVLSVDGVNDVLYAGLPSHGVFRSMDGGMSWTLVNQYLEMRVIKLHVDPNNWRDVVDLSVSFAGSFEAASRSTDGGESWVDIGGDLARGNLFGDNNQGWYDVYITRDPTNPDRMLAGGISVWLSVDGGDNWEDVGLSYRGGIHPDQHCAAFGAGNDPITYFGCDGGIAVSTNKGETFQVYQDDFAITQFYGMDIDQNDDDITYGGTQDNGTLAGGRNGDWLFIAGGDGGTVVVDEDNSNRIFFLRPGDNAYPIKIENGVPSNISNGINPNDSVGWVKPLVMDHENNILYTATQHLYVSTNRGTSWSRRNTKLASGSYVNCIGLSGDGQNIAVGTTGGLLWFSTNNGSQWANRTQGLPGRSVTDIAFAPGDVSTLYATLSGFGEGHVFRSTDKGITWTDVSGSLPDIPCNAIVIDPEKPTNIFIATDIGVFYSPTGGNEWLPYGGNLPHVAVLDLAIHRAKRVIRAGTHGRSMYEAPLPTSVSGVTTPNVASVWYIGEEAAIAWFGLANADKVEISTDGGASWSDVATNPSSSNIDISSVNYQPTTNAVVRVTSGTTVLLSQHFRIQQRRAGSTYEVVSEQPFYIYDITYVPEDNALWATAFNSNTSIHKIDPNTGELLQSINLGPTMSNLTGIKWDAQENAFWIHQANESTNSSMIFKVTKSGTRIGQWESPAQYGTGIFPMGDTLYAADRNNNTIFRVVRSDPNGRYDDILLDRKSSFGPRCISYNPVSEKLLHTWTDFQGGTTNTVLYDSYLLHLNMAGEEIDANFVQEGGNVGTNVRGVEYDPASGGKSVWATILTSGTASKIIKITLTDGELNSVKGKEQNFWHETYPNPFDGQTLLHYELPEAGKVQIIVRDVLGRLVAESNAEIFDAGYHSYPLDIARSADGAYVAILLIDGIPSGTMKLVKR